MPSSKTTTIYKTTGNAIARLRKKRKLSQLTLAGAASVSRASIANIEQGRHRIQLHVLYDIAAALEVEPHDLLPHMARTQADRPLPRDVADKLKNPKEAFAVTRLLEVGKEDLHGTSEITKKANEWLSKAKVTETPVSVYAVAKAMGEAIKHGPLPDELSGFLLHDNGAAVLGVNSLHPKSRQRFTIAHELGHFALHPHANFVDHKVLYFRNPRASQGVDPQEMDANQFAADLLMPVKFMKALLKGEAIDLEDEDKIEVLANEFGVSRQALTYRLLNLQQSA